MPVAIIPLYAALLALLFIFLSLRVIRVRREERVALGDGGNERLRRAMGVHANFAEYVPLALLLIGRLVHAYGVSQSNEYYRFRVFGMMLTFGTIGGSALVLLGKPFF